MINRSVPFLFCFLVSVLLAISQEKRSEIPVQNTLEAERLETDFDSDGVPDQDEYGPTREDFSFDGNNDGTPDFQQRHVASFPTWDGSRYLTLYLGQTAFFAEAATLDPASVKPVLSKEEFPYGFLFVKVRGFRPGGPLIVRVILHEAITPTQFYMYSPLAAHEAARLFAFAFNCDIGVEWYEGHMLIHLVDGFSGDRDLKANGELTLLGGPVFKELPEQYFYPEAGAAFSFHTHMGKKEISVHIDPESTGYLRRVQIEVEQGQVVLDRSIEGEVREYSFDISNLQCGLYTLRVFTDEGTKEEKVLITQ